MNRRKYVTILLVAGVSLSIYATNDEQSKPVPSQDMRYVKIAGYSTTFLTNLLQVGLLCHLYSEEPQHLLHPIPLYIYANFFYSAYHAANRAWEEYTQSFSSQHEPQTNKVNQKAETDTYRYAKLAGCSTILALNILSSIVAIYMATDDSRIDPQHCTNTRYGRLSLLHAAGIFAWNAKLAYDKAEEEYRHLFPKVKADETS